MVREIEVPPHKWKLSSQQHRELVAFRKWRTNFHARWLIKASKHDETDPLSESPEEWLARRVYGHLRRMVRDGQAPILYHLVDFDRSLRKGRYSIQGKPFKVGLIALLGDKIPMLPNRRADLSNAMEYAYMHGVPAKYFNGFTKQAGLKRITTKLTSGHVEPGFKREALLSLPQG